MSGVSVEVSARKVTVPYLCPCCCGVADTALAVSFTRITGEQLMRETTREIDFPYCTRCVRHSQQWSVAWHKAYVVLALGVVAGAAIGLGVDMLVGAGVAAAGALLTAIVGLSLRVNARASCCPACASPARAVTFHGWADNVQSFSFTSRRYAAAFAAQNEHSLVNVTPQLYQLIEQHRTSLQQEQEQEQQQQQAPRRPSRAPAPTRPLSPVRALANGRAQVAIGPAGALTPAVGPASARAPAPTRTPTVRGPAPVLKPVPALAHAPAAVHAAPARAVPRWPQRVDRARSLIDNVVRIDRRAIRGGVVKRSGRTS